jgi:membrane protein
MKSIRSRAEKVYRRVDEATAGALSLLAETIQSFGEAQAAQAGASIAYYAMFSLFPLLIALISAGSFLVNREWVMSQVVAALTDAIPVSQQLIERNISRVFELRGAVGFAGLVGLIWSASAVFSSLVLNVNRAWGEETAPGFIRQRLIALSMVVVLILLVFLSVIVSAFFNVFSIFNGQLASSIGISQQELVRAFSNLSPYFFVFIMFLGIYRWIPIQSVDWKAAIIGAAAGTAGWRLSTSGFTWYLNSSLVNYQLIYGSLGAIVALLFYVYISSQIVLFCAHLTAALDRRFSSEQGA